MLVKVLREGRSCHGGTLTWSLPVRGPDGAWAPGEWHEVDGPIVPCRRGLHVTTAPVHWWPGVGGDAYVVEVDGEIAHDEHKSVARRVRLLRRLDADELRRLRIYLDGTATVSSGQAVADGTAHVVARGDVHVTAFGQATVTALGSARVYSWDTARVYAWDTARVDAGDQASVVAYDQASVVAYDQASVVAYDQASVVAYDQASVVAYDRVRVTAWDEARVVAYDEASVERGQGES